jgi:hypothetical protein
MALPAILAPALWSLAAKGLVGARNLVAGARGANQFALPKLQRGMQDLRTYGGPGRVGQFVDRHPYLTMAGAGTAGGIGYGLLSDDDPVVANQISNEQLPTTTVTAPREVPYVPSSNTTSLVDEARRQMRNADIISNAMFRDNILKNVYGESNYGKFVVNDLATKEEARGNLRAAKQLRAIKNKDGSLPDNARVVFNRLIAEEMDPEMASKFAGLPLEISKTEAKIMKDQLTGQPSVMDTLKPEFQIAQAQQMYASGNQNQRTQAIETIKSLIASNAINLSDVTAGLERPLTNEDKTKIAIEILTGRQGVGDTGVTESDIVLGIN